MKFGVAETDGFFLQTDEDKPAAMRQVLQRIVDGLLAAGCIYHHGRHIAICYIF